MGKLWLFKLGYFTNVFSKGTKWAVTSRKTNEVFVANDKIGTSKQKLEFWKAFICHHEYDSIQYLKDFDENDGAIKESDFLFVMVKWICQYLGDLHNSVNKYFPNDQYMML